MSKQGIFLSVSEDQDGGNPRIVTKDIGLPIILDVPALLYHGIKTVTVAGERVNLDDNITKGVSIKAAVSNTGIIYIGSSGVTAENGFPLAAGDTLNMDISNTSAVWIDSSVDGESVSWIGNA
jgi:hypothetical protein